MEYLDLVDENNILTGDKRLRSEVHSQGFWHRTVHIYIFKKTDDIYFLVHLRSKDKDLKPNCWDTRFGGHIKSGRSIEEGIKSELTEELGLEVENSNLIVGKIYKRDHNPNREFTHSFYHKFDGDISTLKFNDGEVQEIKWMKASDVIDSMNKQPEIWSATISGFTEVFDFLKNSLN